MATALQLNAASVIINGQGLATSANLLAEIQSFQSLETVSLIKSIYATASNTANVSVGPPVTGLGGGSQNFVTMASILMPELSSLGNTATQGHFLIDFYPPDITRVCSTNVVCYGSNVNVAVSNFSLNSLITYTYSPDLRTASMSETIQAQAQLPFINGMAGFANVFQNCYGFANQAFDPISSVKLLNAKTYANSGLGYTGPLDLATGGLGSAGNVLAQAVGGWGTMYDITKLSSIADPYVFGQNLLNQGLGTIGNLTIQFSQAGLNTSDITRIPISTTTTTVKHTTTTAQTPVGSAALPTVSSTTVTSQASGVSPALIMNIYAGVTGDDLQTLITATNISIPVTSTINSLADLLTFDNVITGPVLTELKNLGITDFASLGIYLHRVAGQGFFTSWAGLARFLQSVIVPSTTHTQTFSNSQVLTDSAISTITSQFGTGSGPFGNPIMQDYFGASAGIPYTNSFQTLVKNYQNIQTAPLVSALRTLQNAVNSVSFSNTPTGIGQSTFTTNGIAAVAPAVAAVNAALTAIPVNTEFQEAEQVARDMLNRLAVEVQSLTQAGATFDAGYPQSLKNFGLNLGGTASDTSKIKTYDIFANITTSDAAGDTVRSAIAEQMNLSKFTAAGIQLTNDPGPGMALTQSQNQNISLSTYITQNQ